MATRRPRLPWQPRALPPRYFRVAAFRVADVTAPRPVFAPRAARGALGPWGPCLHPWVLLSPPRCPYSPQPTLRARGCAAWSHCTAQPGPCSPPWVPCALLRCPAMGFAPWGPKNNKKKHFVIPHRHHRAVLLPLPAPRPALLVTARGCRLAEELTSCFLCCLSRCGNLSDCVSYVWLGDTVENSAPGLE